MSWDRIFLLQISIHLSSGNMSLVIEKMLLYHYWTTEAGRVSFDTFEESHLRKQDEGEEVSETKYLNSAFDHLRIRNLKLDIV